jgi:hypothetical protein
MFLRFYLGGISSLDRTDGISIVPVLEGRPEAQKRHQYLYWEFHPPKAMSMNGQPQQAVLMNEWKSLKRISNSCTV